MKNNPILNLSRLAIFIAAMILQFSCQQDDSYNLAVSDATFISLSVSASDTGTELIADDPASAVRSLCILQFKADGNQFGTLRHVSIGRKTVTPGKYDATLLRSMDNETYKFVVVANFPHDDYSLFQRMGGKSYAEVQQACQSTELAGLPAFGEITPFPMFGIAKNGLPIQVGENVDLGTVSLVRAVARVNVGIGDMNTDGTWTGKVGGNPVLFKMSEIRIYKARNRYAYMPVENNFTSVAGTLSINNPSPAGDTWTMVYDNTYIKGDSAYCSGQIYLPEADLQWGSEFDDKHTDRMAIIVKGQFLSLNPNKKETYYRMDFTYDMGDKMNVLRNHIYQFSIKSVKDDGYDTADEAYKARNSPLSFTATTVEEWVPGVDVTPKPIEGYVMFFGELNGEITSGSDGSGGQLILKEKSDIWEGENFNIPVAVDYDTFYGEVPGNLKRSAAYPNGDIYSDKTTLLHVEGVYPDLMVAADDVYDSNGNAAVPWKDGLVLTAFDMCRDYLGLGYSDWRLPRASELYLIYLNKTSLESQRGFTNFSGTYWSGSEKGNATDPVAESAWAVNLDTPTGGMALGYANKVTGSCKIRCVRQVKKHTSQ